MAFIVLRTRAVREAVDQMSKRERRAYNAAVDALKGEGCAAGGKRLAAIGGGDFPICQRSLYAAWRLTTAYLRDGRIVITLSRSTPTIGSRQKGSPRLSVACRLSAEQPPCCDDPTTPPTLTPELEGSGIRSVRRLGLGGLGRRRGVERDAKHAAVLGNHPRATHRATPRVRDLAHIHQARRGGLVDATSSTLSPARRARLATAWRKLCIDGSAPSCTGVGRPCSSTSWRIGNVGRPSGSVARSCAMRSAR